MHGRNPIALLCFLVVLAGCDGPPEPQTGQVAPAAPAILGEQFDEAATGTLSGTVTWKGDLPEIPPFKPFGLPGDYGTRVRQEQPNPNAPRIDPASGAMADVVVFLRQVDLKKSRPWDHAPVVVHQRERRLLLRQGECSSHIGWARVGEAIAAINDDDHFHMLRGRGAAFFSLPFVGTNARGRRVLDKPGVVELSSGAFFFWMRAYLLVGDHPYYARTNAQGQFRLDKVPAGSHELVSWLPSWHLAAKLRDPESGLVVHVEFKPGVEKSDKVELGAGQRREVSFAWRLDDFTAPAAERARRIK